MEDRVKSKVRVGQDIAVDAYLIRAEKGDEEHQRLIKAGYREYEYEPPEGDEPVGNAWQGKE